MRKYISSIFIAMILCAVSAFANQADEARQPIKIHRTLYRTSNFLFWNSTKKIDLLITVFDKDKDGQYDSYKWWEDGQCVHAGQFSTTMEDALFTKKLLVESIDGDNAYYSEGTDEYQIKIPSKLNNSITGIIKINADFDSPMLFEYVRDNFRQKVRIKLDPLKDTFGNRVDYYFNVKKDKLSRNGSYIESHHIILTDANNDGNAEYYYFIDGLLICDGPFKSIISLKDIKRMFANEVLQNNTNVFEKYPDRVRVSVASKKDDKSFAYFDLRLDGDKTMTYFENSNYDNPYVSIAEKLGVSVFPNPCSNTITLITGGLMNMNATIDLYRNNIFLRNYYTGIIKSQRMSFDVSDYQSGSYQFIIIADNEIIFPLLFIINK